MKQKDYQRTTAAAFAGKKVRAVEPLRNFAGEVPVGTILTIKDKMNGFELYAEPCPHCHVQLHFRRVPPEFVELVEE